MSASEKLSSSCPPPSSLYNAVFLYYYGGNIKKRKPWKKQWTKGSFSTLFIIWTIFQWCLCSFQFSEGALNTLSRRVVHIKQGIIQGFLGPGNVRPSYTSSYNYNFRGYGGRPIVEIFKGIPYASKPVKALRYESPDPVPYSGSNDVFFANITKPSCPRTSAEILNRTNSVDPIRSLQQTLNLEDCLYLNIWLPFNADKEKGDGPGLPVLVYVNSQADDSNDPWDGSSMAAIGNIMVIQVNFRSGVLGFVKPGFSDEVRSNFGLWDMLAALGWIKEHIDKFGGDPNLITLMGYDVDASLVGVLALSRISADAYGGLFHRIILLNGSPFSPTSINHQPLDTTFHLSTELKCPLHERTTELVSCLRSKTTPQLLTAAEKMGTPLLSYRFAPNIDGTIVKDDFMQNGMSKVNMDLLGKYDLLCGLSLSGGGPTLPRVGLPPWQNFNLEQFVTAVIKLTLRMEPSSDPTNEVKRNLVKAIVAEYGPSPSMDELISDFLLVHPVISLLKAHSRTGKQTFFYLFKDFDPQGKGKHSEIPYIFSTEVYRWKYAGSPQTIAELQTFEALITLLANFVRTGDPNMSDRSEVKYTNAARSWPKYTEDMGLYLEIGKDVDVPSNYRKSQMVFWSRVFPAVIRPFAQSIYNGNLSNHEIFHFGNFNPNQNYNPNIHIAGGGSNPNIPNPFHPNRNVNMYPTATTSTTNSSLSQNAVVLIGCLLLLLNSLCFLGLFYQRERLKKAEIQLRRRYMESQPHNSHHASDNGHDDVDINDDESAYDRAPPPRLITTTPHQRPMMISSSSNNRDAMSETETENGFGPDFLGPNELYNPRTKVNRWMNLQNQVGNSPSPIDLNNFHHHHNNHHHQLSPPPPAMQIQVSSVQRSPKPAQVLPTLPYQEPFQPLQNYDIPFADSRNTSPSIVTSTAFNNNLTTNNFNNSNRRNIPPLYTTEGGKETPLASSPKRGSVLIVRDLDPVDDEVEKIGPKFIPVKTGTLKRSVGVGIDENAGKELTFEPDRTTTEQSPPPEVTVNNNTNNYNSSPITTTPTAPAPTSTPTPTANNNSQQIISKKITFADGL